MTTEHFASSAPIAASGHSTWRLWRIGVILVAGSAFAFIMVYLAFAVPGPWFKTADPVRWTAGDIGVTRGSVKLLDDGVAVLASDQGTVLLTLNSSFGSRDYPVIAWNVANVPDTVRATLLWRNDHEPTLVHSEALVVEGGHIAPVLTAGNPHWAGTISGLGLMLRGEFTQPILVGGAIAKPMTAVEELRDRSSEWLAFEPWNGASINTVIGGADLQFLSLPFLLAAVVALAACAYAVLARWYPRFSGTFNPLFVAGILFAAWFLLDVRWQLNLLRQLATTYEQYGGKTWRERHLAAEDGALFAFIEKVRAKLPPPPARVFIAADNTYFRDRAAWHLYPYNVYFNPTLNIVPPASVMRPGDYLVVFQRKGIQFNAAQGRVRWDGGEPVAAQLLLVDAGAALFQIR